MKALSGHPALRGRGLDARAVLLASLGLILAVKSLNQGTELALGAIVLAALVIALGIPWRAFLVRSLWVLPFCLAALPLIFTVPGPTLFTVAGTGWTATIPGLARFLIITAQCLLCLQVILIGSSVSSPFALVRAMGRLGCPQRLVAVLSLCLRYMDLLSEELSRLQRARESRGCSEPGLAFRARITGQLVGTLFLRSLGRAERVEVAMRSRGGMSGTFPSRPEVGRWGVAETSVLGLAAAIAGISWTW